MPLHFRPEPKRQKSFGKLREDSLGARQRSAYHTRDPESEDWLHDPYADDEDYANYLAGNDSTCNSIHGDSNDTTPINISSW